METIGSFAKDLSALARKLERDKCELADREQRQKAEHQHELASRILDRLPETCYSCPWAGEREMDQR